MTEKIDELVSLVKALDTKILFVMEDLETVKTELENVKELCLTVAMSHSQSAEQSAKTSRLEQFKQASQRW